MGCLPGYRGAPLRSQSQPGPSAVRRALLAGSASPMLGFMASPWKTLQQRLGKAAENLVFNEGPKFIRQLQNSPTLQRGISQGIRLGLDVITRGPEPAKEITSGRPVTKNSVPTAYRARKVLYSPDLDGRADPGEIVWTWVVYEDDPVQGQRPPGARRRPRPQHAAGADVVQPGAPRRRPELDRHRHRRLGLRRPRQLGAPGQGARRARRRHQARGRGSGTRDVREDRRTAACRVLLELTRRTPHRPHRGPAVRELDLGGHLETEPAVIRDKLWLARLQICGRILLVAPVETGMHQRLSTLVQILCHVPTDRCR